MMEPMVQLARVLPIVLHPAVIVCATEKLSLKKKKKKVAVDKWKWPGN